MLHPQRGWLLGYWGYGKSKHYNCSLDNDIKFVGRMVTNRIRACWIVLPTIQHALTYTLLTPSLRRYPIRHERGNVGEERRIDSGEDGPFPSATLILDGCDRSDTGEIEEDKHQVGQG